MRRCGIVLALMVVTSLTGCQSNNNEVQTITKDEAKEIVLKDSNVNESDITYYSCIEDYDDDDIHEYDISFTTSDTKYKYEVSMDEGKIINKENEANPSSIESNPIEVTPIDELKAKEIALKHAGFSEDQITNYKITTDDDTGYYEVEFNADNKEHEVDIDPANGQVIKYNIDLD